MLNSDTVIELENISFAYNSEDVIKDVSLMINRGDYVGLVGPNGGGKSTLLKIMLGLLKPRSGTVRLFGQTLDSFKDWSKIGYVPQNKSFDINFPATVAEVVGMGRFGKLGLFRFPTSKDRSQVHQALEQVEMLPFSKRQIGDLSGGQIQRALIAKTLVSEPQVIFLDEPTAGVDVKTQKQFYSLLRKLNNELNLTLILVTHELDVVAHESNKLGYINRTMEYFGDPNEFLKGKYFHELIGKAGLHH